MSFSLILPDNYKTPLGVLETEIAIKAVKDTFERELSQNLHLTRVSAPLFVQKSSGLNDDLNGVERPVSFDIPAIGGDEIEIVHSLAKWKRQALKFYEFTSGNGLYTDMNAIRRDEELDNLHSAYVDQWDWEKLITKEDRTKKMLEHTARRVMAAICETERLVCDKFSRLTPFLNPTVTFMTTDELLSRYPDLSPKEREDAVCKEYGTVFIEEIGDAMANGERHDGRAPDYDDWHLNGDLLIWYPVLNRSVELSSMGVRVDEVSLKEQLEKAGCPNRAELPFHKMLLNGELPYTIGGGIGQSRICMVMLQKAHIGEVHASVWSDKMREECRQHGINLL